MWLLASLLCLMPCLAHIDYKEVVGIIGENFTFPVQINQERVETVWKKNKDKVAEWEGLNKPTYFGPFHNRSVLMKNGSLTIVNLKKDDAGTYELQYWDSVNDHSLNFILVVLDSLPEPEISCNSSDGKVVLNCTAHFQRPLNYAWKLSGNPRSFQDQELSIPLDNVDTTTNATCIIKLSQTERSSEISLSQCIPEEKGSSSHKRNRGALIGAFVVTGAIILVAILLLLWRKGIIKLGTRRRTAQNNRPVNGSGEHEQLFSGNSQQQPNSEGDTALNEAGSALKEKQIVKNGVNQEDTSKNKSSLLASHDHADGHGINEGEVTQDAEGENGEHLNNSSSCNKVELKA